jgi:GYF domain 2
MKPETLFYIQRDDAVAGPYDLVQMAGLLRKKIINPETMTRCEGEDGWKPFSWQPQFSVAREMSPDAVSTRIEALNEKAQVERAPVPLPSAALMLQMAAGVAALLVLGVVVYFVSSLNLTLGVCLAIAGVACALMGTCLAYVRFADENILTQLKVFIVPFYDIYYLVANFSDYLPYFCAKCVGVVVATAALAGIASGHSDDAQQLQSMFHLYGL